VVTPVASFVPPGRRPEDDLPSDLSRRPGVLENFQWYGHDPVSGFSFIAHHGTLPGSPHLWHAVVYVYLPDGRELGDKQVGPALNSRSSGTTIHHIECLEPFRLWRFRFHGGARILRPAQLEDGLARDGASVELDLDLHLRAAGPVWDPTPTADKHEGWTDLHHEQSMLVDGRVSTAGSSWTVANGIGYRDHSVGPRDLRQIASHSWSNGYFPSTGRSFGSLLVGHLDGSSTTRGYVVRDGSVEDADVVTMPGLDNVRGEPASFDVQLSVRGRAAQISGTLLPERRSNFSIAGPAEWTLGTEVDSPDTYFLAQRLVRWEWDGDVGYGMSDRGGLLSLFV
jgi:hypothetical protein